MVSAKAWDPSTAPRLDGKTVLITGASSGLGQEAAGKLAGLGATVVLACRNEAKAAETMAAIAKENPSAKLEFLQVDLCSQASVKKAAAEFKKSHKELKLLFLNAGVMATPFAITKDGFEEQMAATHFGHYTLTGLLLDELVRGAPSRVVTHSSSAHQFSKGIDLSKINEKRGAWSVYGDAKLANLLFTTELNRRLAAKHADVIATAAHPGYTSTNLQSTPGMGPKWLASTMNTLFAQDVTVGVQPLLYAGLGADIVGNDFCGPKNSGGMYGPAVKCSRSKPAQDAEAAKALWATTAKLTGFDYLQ